MSRLRWVMSFIFLVALALCVVIFNASKPRLLILQSYDKDYAWTRDVDIGIDRALKEQHEYSTRWFYMDAKRHPWEEFKINAGKAVQALVKNWQPTVVIAVDDDAQEYAMKHFINRPDIQIVYSGVNDALERYGYDKATNVTGIREIKPFAALKETLLLIADTKKHTGPLRIQFLGDPSASVHSDEAEFRKFAWDPIKIIDPVFPKTFDEWKTAVKDAGKNGIDFLITANYRKIVRSAEDKTLMPPSEIVKWTQDNSPVPVIGTNGFFVDDGGMLAIGTSPFEQGEVAAAMANDLLRHGMRVGDIPKQTAAQFVVAMRKSGLRKWNISLPAVYEAAARSSANFYP